MKEFNIRWKKFFVPVFVLALALLPQMAFAQDAVQQKLDAATVAMNKKFAQTKTRFRVFTENQDHPPFPRGCGAIESIFNAKYEIDDSYYFPIGDGLVTTKKLWDTVIIPELKKSYNGKIEVKYEDFGEPSAPDALDCAYIFLDGIKYVGYPVVYTEDYLVLTIYRAKR